jgi:aspartyl-tRNA(Asn)/glutamyl-tRNA(Gln) amidotransferase subunit B
MERLLRSPISKRLFECAIGLEVHAQITASSQKLFSNTITRAPSSSSSSSTSSSTSFIKPFDVAHPGTLPQAPNKECVFQAIRTGLALKGDISTISSFERKHYTYPDLPHGYQITQLYQPIVTNGSLIFSAPLISQNRNKNNTLFLSRPTNLSNIEKGRIPSLGTLFPKKCGIDRIQLEMDSGKSIFKKNNTSSSSSSSSFIENEEGESEITLNEEGFTWTIDFKRAGVALLEIVSFPDLRSPEEAANYLKSLISLLKRIGVNDGMLEEGALRCDVNVSVRNVSEEYIQVVDEIEVFPFIKSVDNENPSTTSSSSLLQKIDEFRRQNLLNFGSRVEMKNLSSLRAVYRAIEHESERQILLLEQGQVIERETRSFDFLTRTSARLRSKSTLMDYRFMPEPDLVPLVISKDMIDKAKISLPELPNDIIQRLINSFGLSHTIASSIVNNEDEKTVLFFENVLIKAITYVESTSMVSNTNKNELIKKMAKPVANWILNDLFGLLHKANDMKSISHTNANNNNNSSPSFGEIISLSNCGISVEWLGELVALVENGYLSGKRGKAILAMLITGKEVDENRVSISTQDQPLFPFINSKSKSNSKSPREIAEENGWLIKSLFTSTGVTNSGNKNENEINTVTYSIKQHAITLVNDPKHKESVQKWRIKGSDRVHSALVKALLETSKEAASNPKLASDYIKEALGPLGQRDEAHIGRKAARKLAEEEKKKKKEE